MQKASVVQAANTCLAFYDAPNFRVVDLVKDPELLSSFGIFNKIHYGLIEN